MDAQQTERLADLRDEWVSEKFLVEYLGVPWPPSEEFIYDYDKWQHSRKRQSGADGKVSRWDVEAFLRDNRLQSLPWAAVSMGMTEDSLQKLLIDLPEIGLRRNYVLYPGFVDDALADDLIRSLKGMRFRTFGSHNSFCEMLHAILRDSHSVEIETSPCTTSVELGEDPVQFASQFDSITLDPLCVRHMVWLDLGKPISLKPDRCSKLLVAKNRSELEGLLAGTGDADPMGIYGSLLKTAGVPGE